MHLYFYGGIRRNKVYDDDDDKGIWDNELDKLEFILLSLLPTGTLGTMCHKGEICLKVNARTGGRRYLIIKCY